MDLIDRFKGYWYGTPNQRESVHPPRPIIFNPKLSRGRTGDPGLKEITYFTCLRILSETVAKIHIDIVDDSNEPVDDRKYYSVLNTRVTPVSSKYDWLQYVVFCIYHYGNYYGVPTFSDKGYLTRIDSLDPRKVTVYVDNANIMKGKSYVYSYTENDNGNPIVFLPEEIIHIKGFSENGLVGLGILQILREVLNGSLNAQDVVSDQYAAGMMPTCVLQYTGDLNTEKRKSLLKAIQEIMTGQKDHEGPKSRIVPIPLGMTLSPLNMKLSDSEFTELRKYTASQIAAAFGIPLTYLNQTSSGTAGDPDKQSQQLYSATIQPLLAKIELELTYKLLSTRMLQNRNEIRFRVNDILSVDAKTKAEINNTYLKAGVYSINDVRASIGLPDIQGGDDHILNNGASIILRDGEWVTLNSTNPTSSENTNQENTKEE